METKLIVDPTRVVEKSSPLLFSHFIEHFHRQVYGGVFDPESPLSDSRGIRLDVVEAVKAIGPPAIRWPGGCFASAYHWQDGVGADRSPAFDKAWRVEDPNTFGTDEFVRFCNAVGAEPYICTNAGTGTIEEMSSWVEYCNLGAAGKWSRQRRANGFPDPHRVRYWSIGNENYGSWEIGAKDSTEWASFVREAAKIMRAVDPTIEIFAAATVDLDWNLDLLREAAQYIDWLSIHAYWDPLWERNELSSYEMCMAYSLEIRRTIERAEHILGALDLLGKIKIAIDEWNLRGWHHPHRMSGTEDFLTPRNLNDVNSSYTMADAVFTACFLNESLRHCGTVRMTNFSPLVNCRGLVYVHRDGIVLRSMYHVFSLYANQMTGDVVDCRILSNTEFSVASASGRITVPAIDCVATTDRSAGRLRISVVNRHPDQAVRVTVSIAALDCLPEAAVHRLEAPSTESFNDVESPEVVKPKTTSVPGNGPRSWSFSVEPHSVNIVHLSCRCSPAH